MIAGRYRYTAYSLPSDRRPSAPGLSNYKEVSGPSVHFVVSDSDFGILQK